MIVLPNIASPKTWYPASLQLIVNERQGGLGTSLLDSQMALWCQVESIQINERRTEYVLVTSQCDTIKGK